LQGDVGRGGGGWERLRETAAGFFRAKRGLEINILLAGQGWNPFSYGSVLRQLTGAISNLTSTPAMPTFAAPRSDDARLATLETISTTAALDNDDAKLLPAALRQRVDAFLPGYRPVVQAVEAATAGRAKEVTEKDKALKSLTTHVQDFFEVLKRRTARLDHDVSALVHYGLPQSGDVPKLVAETAVESAADGIVEGEAAAVAAGFPAMVNPSAAEVKTALDSYRKESAEVVPADARVRQAQIAAAAQRELADDLLSDVKDELSHALRKLEGPAERRVLRLFGFKFTPNAGEKPEESMAAPVVP